MSRRSAHNHEPQGQVTFLSAVGLIVLLVISGLGIDIGNIWTAKHQIQIAADSAARAAAREIAEGHGKRSIFDSAQSEAAKQGYTNGDPGVRIDIRRPPIDGDLARNNGAVEAIVSASVSTFCMRLFGISAVPIRMHSEAVIPAEQQHPAPPHHVRRASTQYAEDESD